mmetsp:Transcript_5121/g.5256  ORF Transcript_5121/g.5256 Transcript_5121/m.5256 type:complete len:218 (+) Transcript_5121:806-1459(+)
MHIGMNCIGSFGISKGYSNLGRLLNTESSTYSGKEGSASTRISQGISGKTVWSVFKGRRGIKVGAISRGTSLIIWGTKCFGTHERMLGNKSTPIFGITLDNDDFDRRGIVRVKAETGIEFKVFSDNDGIISAIVFNCNFGIKIFIRFDGINGGISDTSVFKISNKSINSFKFFVISVSSSLTYFLLFEISTSFLIESLFSISSQCFDKIVINSRERS